MKRLDAILFAGGRIAPAALPRPAVDLVMGIAFAWIWVRLRPGLA